MGVVLSFYSNQQSYDSIESLRDSVEEISDTAVGYVGSILDVRTCTVHIRRLHSILTMISYIPGKEKLAKLKVIL